jgi:hypothetical protein
MAKTATAPTTAIATTNGRRRRHVAPPAATSPAMVATAVAVAVSAKTRHLIDAIRDDFTGFSDGFSQLTVSRAELAPRFMKAFAAWAQETGSTFINFVRVLDPSVPEDRDGYRAHASYQAADNLRRLGAGVAREPIPEDDRPVSAYQALAYLVATVLPLIDPTGSFWSAFVKEMRWTDAQNERLKLLAVKVGPVQLPPRIKGNLQSLRATA